MRGLAWLVPVAVAAVLGASGCGADRPGEGAAGASDRDAGSQGGEGGQPVPSSGPSNSSGSVGGADSASLDPCALLSPSGRSEAGLSSVGEATTVAGARACDYTQPGDFGVTVTLDEESVLDELRERIPGAETVRVGAQRALRVADEAADDGTCSLLLSVGGEREVRTVHVDVTMAGFHDTRRACTRATTVAELIEREMT